jgi:hypothetical protein
VTNREQLVSALWDLFSGDIESRGAVFFSFSQETLRDHLRAKAIESDSPLKTVCDAALTCLRVCSHSVALMPDALTPLSCGRSMAIVLVCQQVLAVEEMTRDASRFSENAYFPRLRALISKDLPFLSLNPFSFAEFRDIWGTFEREILACKGGSSETVTFKFDDFTGGKRAKQFPLSQALLSRGDLVELNSHARATRLRSGTLREAWDEIRRCRFYLGRRAQRLINAGLLREEIVEQVRRFTHRVSPLPSLSGASSIEVGQLHLGIAIDSADWFEQQYRAFVMRPGSRSPLQDDALVAQKLESLLHERSYLILPFSESERYWSCQESDVEIASGDTVLVLAKPQGMQRARAVLDGLIPSVPLPEQSIAPLGRLSGFQVCPVILTSDNGFVIKVRKGRLHQEQANPSQTSSFEWIGGLCVEKRSRKYLRDALPTAVRFGSQQIAIRDLVMAGGFSMSWTTFERSLGTLQTDVSYELRFPNRRVARLSVAVLPRVTPERVGFPISDCHLVSPRLRQLGELEPALIGYLEPERKVSPASIQELSELIRAVKERRPLDISQSECAVLLNRIEASTAPPAVKRLIRAALPQQSNRNSQNA